MDLPAHGSQDLLITAVAAVNRNTIVINSTGSPISMPWLSSVAAVIQAWFPGQEAGGSIADVVLGGVNPSGKLPVTFPRSLSDTPAYGNFPGNLETNIVNYAEGIYVGYRHYDRKPDGILFPFGFGLSYTSFLLSDFTISDGHLTKGDSLTISVDVTNTGAVPGRQVVQAYIGHNDKLSTVDRPEKQLSGFAKTALLQPGQNQIVNITIEDEFAAYWSEDEAKWVVLPGTYSILIGTSSQSISGTVEFEVMERYEFHP
jgi:beta-glucosidase